MIKRWNSLGHFGQAVLIAAVSLVLAMAIISIKDRRALHDENRDLETRIDRLERRGEANP